jgi:hypothetical protein
LWGESPSTILGLEDGEYGGGVQKIKMSEGNTGIVGLFE